MRVRLLTLIAIVLVAAGCSAWEPKLPTGFVTGTSMHTIAVGAAQRAYRLYKPAGLPASAPLVVMLHGYSGSARQAERSYGWDELADTAKFVVAYPDGVDRSWNADSGGCCGDAGHDGVDDLGFIKAAVTDIEKNLHIDPARVDASGMSNGAIMAYTLACETDIFAAIGPVAGTQLNSCGSPRPTSVMEVHGNADQLVPYQGGQGAGIINGPSLQEVNAFWRNADRCGAPVTKTSDEVTTSTAGCADNRGVVLVTVDGGGHEWPSFATARLWEFFAAHPR